MCPQHAAQLCGAAIPKKAEQALKTGDQQSTLTDSPHSAVFAQTTCLAGRNRRPIHAKPPDRSRVNQICGSAMASVARDPRGGLARAHHASTHTLLCSPLRSGGIAAWPGRGADAPPKGSVLPSRQSGYAVMRLQKSDEGFACAQNMGPGQRGSFFAVHLYCRLQDPGMFGPGPFKTMSQNQLRP